MIRPYFSGGLMMKAKTMWFLVSTAVILALAATIIALGLSTKDSVQERRTQMDHKEMWTQHPESAKEGPTQPNNLKSSFTFTADSQSPLMTRRVIINRTPLSNDHLRALEAQYHYRLPDGRYWYDKISGAWGMEGGQTLGFTIPGLDLGGPLRADASNGQTHVFINCRQLHYF